MINDFISRLQYVRQTKPRKGFKRSWLARCPAHSDNSPSLYVDEKDDGRVLLICRSHHCSAGDILNAVGMEWDALFPKDSHYPGFRREKGIDYHELVLAMMADYRKQGKKMTQADKDLELEAYRATRR